MTDGYKPRIVAEHLGVIVRQLRYRLHCWGNPKAEPVFLLHGWADSGMSFQFLADAMSDNWYLIAPDWRGFGDSEWHTGGYWFPDYLADLDELISIYAADNPVRLVGHSMGGNVVWLYSGVYPDRVCHAVSLDSIGLAETAPTAAPDRYQTWLQQLRSAPAFLQYNDLDAVTSQIKTLAPRIQDSQARFLADYWSRKNADGKYTLNADPAHKHVNPVLYRREEARSCWRNITAKSLLVLSKDSHVYKSYYEEEGQADVQSCFHSLTEQVVTDTGHLLHLEQPEKLAQILDAFLST